MALCLSCSSSSLSLWLLQFSLAISSHEQSALPQSVSSSFPSAFSWEQKSDINLLLITPIPSMPPWSCPPAPAFTKFRDVLFVNNV